MFSSNMDNYVFQLATYEDIPEITTIYQSLVGTPGCAWNSDYPNEETAKEDIDNGWLYILKKDGKIIGAVSAGDFDWFNDLQWKPKNPCDFARIGVAPAFQSRGIGTIMVQNVIKIMKSKGFDGIRLIVSKTNPAALALYEKNGFERCGEIYMFDIDFYRYQIEF